MFGKGVKKYRVAAAAGLFTLVLAATPVKAHHGYGYIAPLAAFIAFSAFTHHGHHRHYRQHRHQHQYGGHHRRHSHSQGGYNNGHRKQHRNW